MNDRSFYQVSFFNSAWWELRTVSTLPYTPKLKSKYKYRVTCNSLINVTIESHQTNIPTTHISRVSCQKGPTRHAYAWQIGPFWQDILDMRNRNHPTPNAISYRLVIHTIHLRNHATGLLSFYCPVYGAFDLGLAVSVPLPIVTGIFVLLWFQSRLT